MFVFSDKVSIEEVSDEASPLEVRRPRVRNDMTRKEAPSLPAKVNSELRFAGAIAPWRVGSLQGEWQLVCRRCGQRQEDNRLLYLTDTGRA